MIPNSLPLRPPMMILKVTVPIKATLGSKNMVSSIEAIEIGIKY